MSPAGMNFIVIMAKWQKSALGNCLMIWIVWFNLGDEFILLFKYLKQIWLSGAEFINLSIQITVLLIFCVHAFLSGRKWQPRTMTLRSFPWTKAA